MRPSDRVVFWKAAGRIIVFLWFFIGGVAHFAYTEPFLRIMPPYIPYPLAAIYLSGAFELMGAFGLIFKSTRGMAGIGLILLTCIVTLANIQMYLHPELFPNIPQWALIARFPLQAMLIWMIWWSTRPDAMTDQPILN